MNVMCRTHITAVALIDDIHISIIMMILCTNYRCLRSRQEFETFHLFYFRGVVKMEFSLFTCLL